MAQIDLRNTTIRISDGGVNYLDVKIGEGSLDWIEKREIDFLDNRGVIDTARESKQVPVEVSTVFVWEFLSGSAGNPPTVEDALKRRNEAAAWESTSPDPLAPYCVDLTILNVPPCSGVPHETITLSQFHYTELAHVLKDATVALKGACNIRMALAVREVP